MSFFHRSNQKRWLALLCVPLLAIGCLAFSLPPATAQVDQTNGGSLYSWNFSNNDTIHFTGAGSFIPAQDFTRDRDFERTTNRDHIVYSGTLCFDIDGNGACAQGPVVDRQACTRAFLLELKVSDVERVLGQLGNGDVDDKIPIDRFLYGVNGGSDVSPGSDQCINDEVEAFVDNVRSSETPNGELNVAHYVYRTGNLDPNTFRVDPDDPGNNDFEEEEDPTCTQSFPPGVGWAICTGIDWVDSVLGKMMTTLDRLLSINESEVNTDAMRKAWSYFRNIASLLLVVIGLIMIIGQAISKE